MAKTVSITLQVCIAHFAMTVQRVIDHDSDTLRVVRPAPTAELSDIAVLWNHPPEGLVERVVVIGGRHPVSPII